MCYSLTCKCNRDQDIKYIEDNVSTRRETLNGALPGNVNTRVLLRMAAPRAPPVRKGFVIRQHTTPHPTQILPKTPVSPCTRFYSERLNILTRRTNTYLSTVFIRSQGER
jgi:hypothetical protein